MEIVSEDFKKSIRATEREIKGYVEIIYDEQNNNEYLLTVAPNNLRNSLITEIMDGTRKIKQYASLEENYTKLDGSFILPNYNIKGVQSGYISDDIFSNIENPIITLSKENDFAISSGFTIYFENNIAQNFSITILQSNDIEFIIDVVGNQKNIYQHVFENRIEIKSWSINITKMEYLNRRIRISEIDFGLSQVYEGNDLLSFTVNEEIDLLLTKAPINNCSINLNNYEKMFDPLNPIGLVRFLNNNCIIKPYIGVLTNGNGIEYVSMGSFYLKKWSTNNDCNITLEGQNLMGIISNLKLKSDGGLCTSGFDDSMLSNYLHKIYGHAFKFHFSEGIRFMNIKKVELLECLLTLSSFKLQKSQPLKLFVSRSNVFTIDNIDLNVIDTISATDMKTIPQCTIIDDINTINVTIFQYDKVSSLLNREDVLNQTYTLTEEEEYVWFIFNKRASNIDSKFSYTNSGNGQAKLIDQGTNLAYIKFTGNIGDKITVHLNSYVINDPSKANITFTNGKKNGDTLDLNYGDYFELSNDQAKQISNYYLSQNRKYEIASEYIGDPSLTPGDMITVETKFGNKNIILTKNSLTFDGGLTGNFRGVGD